MPKNIKIDNINIDGDSDINWEDLIKINNGDRDEDVETNFESDATEDIKNN
jgi:hypothetical protein